MQEDFAYDESLSAWRASLQEPFDTCRDAQDRQGYREESLIKASAQFKRRIDAARRDLLQFYYLCFRDDRGQPVVIKYFHKEWRDLILRNNYVLIQAPRGSTKTTFVAIVAPLWFLGHDQNHRIALLCGNDGQAAKRLAAIKAQVEKNPVYSLVFPKVELDPDQKNDGLNLNLVRTRKTKDYTIQARGILSDGTGDRVSILVVDDVCNYKNTIQEPGLRPKVAQKFRGEWLPTLDPRDGKAWNIFTPWEASDSNMQLVQQGKRTWAYRRYHHGTKDNIFHSIFPELFSEEYLRGKYEEQGALEYYRAYLTTLKDDAIQIVRAEWINTLTRHDISRDILTHATCVISVDPSGGKKSEVAKKHDPDFFGFTVALILTDSQSLEYQHINAARPNATFRIMVMDNYAAHLTQSQAVHHTARLHKRWQADYIIVEQQGPIDYIGWLLDYYPHLAGIVIPIPAPTSKRQRLESITPLLESPKQHVLFQQSIIAPKPEPFQIYIPKPQPAQVQALRPLRNQMLNFPTKNDDALDSFTHLLRFARASIIPQSLDDEANHAGVNIDVEAKVLEF